MSARASRASDRPGALDLWVVGHTNLDVLLSVPRLPRPDRTVPVTAREVRLGGTAANLARSAASWGVRTGLVSRVGSDFPPEFRARLERAGVDLRGLVVDRRWPTPACFIAEDGSGGQSTLIDQGAMRDGARFDGPPSLFAESPWSHLTTGPPDLLLDVRRAVLAAGSRYAVDPAQEVHYRWDGKRLARLLDGAEILFGNRHELDRVAHLLRLSRWARLVDRVPLVVRTEGDRGATALSRNGPVHVPAVRPRRLRQVTGAGDAFRGGFYAGWFEGLPLEGCLRAGVRSAARWIERGGLPDDRSARTGGGGR